MNKRTLVEYGEYIISDPEICGGELIFKGTRIFVKDVLEMVAEGMPWEQIVETWFGRISHDAIAEAVALANAALREKAASQRRAA